MLPVGQIRRVFSEQGGNIKACVDALPCDSILVEVPRLLLHLTPGKTWPTEIQSEELLQFYLAVVFYVESRYGDTGHFAMVKQALKKEQCDILRGLLTGDALALAYINTYERAIVKYIHIIRKGSEASLAPDSDGKPPPLYFVLTMHKEVEEEMKVLFTTK